MKVRNYIYMLLAGTIAISSCSKEFLDEKPPTSLAIDVAISNEKDMADAVNGMYAAMRNSSFLGREVPLLGDQIADNAYIALSNSGRFLRFQNYTYIITDAEPLNIWTQGYLAILQANRVIDAAKQLTETPNTKQLLGEAYAARALSYLTLVNLFARPFTVEPNAPGVPLVLSPIYVTGAQYPARASVSAVYDQIIGDLNTAFTLMPTTGVTAHAINSNYIAKYATKAIQARAYLYKGDYANAILAAREVVTNGGYTLAASTAYVGYWANPVATTTKQETIFELALNLATNNGTAGLDYMYNQNGYGDLIAYDALYNSFSATDVRKSLFITGNAKGFVNNKYSNTANTSEKDDVKIIRYSEVLLTLAEAYARTGDNTNALTFVNQVAKQRDPAFVGYTASATLADDIVAERRKELAFEGLRYFDLTRLNLPVNRPAQAGTAVTVSTLPITSFRRILPIPQQELDANINIAKNPSY